MSGDLFDGLKKKVISSISDFTNYSWFKLVYFGVEQISHWLNIYTIFLYLVWVHFFGVIFNGAFKGL